MYLFRNLFYLIGFVSTNLILSGAAKPAELLRNLPLTFEENQGQTDVSVLFTASTPGAKLFLTRQGVTFATGVGEKRSALRLSVVGSNPKSKLVGERQTGAASSFFRGSDPTKWVKGARQFGAVRVQNVKPGIDLVYYGNGRELEYDIVLRPGAQPDQLRLQFEGADHLSLDKGDLTVRFGAGTMRQRKPIVWQENAGKRNQIAAEYFLEKNNLIGIRLWNYDRTQKLTIDPVLSFATYLGGREDDGANAVAVDASGSVYVTGFTHSPDFPTSIGAYRVAINGNGNNVFVTKLNPAGTAIVYSTYLAGSSLAVATGIALDASGNAFITGINSASDFPTTAGSLATVRGNSSMFVTKLNASGNALIYSTFLGQKNNDEATAIAVDSTGSAYVAGLTYGQFPVTPGAYMTVQNRGIPPDSTDAFVAKLSPAGDRLLYATYLGGSLNDGATGIALDTSGQAYITGTTSSTDFPISAGAVQSSFPSSFLVSFTGFVVCLDPTGSALTYSTYLGGSLYGARPAAIALDSQRNAYVAGTTSATDYPTTVGAFSRSLPLPGYHGFLSKLNNTGTAFQYSTLLGGSGNDSIDTVAVDSSGSAIVSGTTLSSDFPTTPGAFPRVQIPSENSYGVLFLTKFNLSGTAVLYSTLFGASGLSIDHGIALDNTGNPVVVGSTLTKTFPTPLGSLQQTNPDGVTVQVGTAFLAKIDLTSTTMCSLSASATLIAAPLAGTSGNILVTANPGCPWEATVPKDSNGYNFVALGTPSGVGSGSFTYSIPANYTLLSARTTGILVGGLVISVNQPGGACNQPGVFPLSQTFDSGGGLNSLSVQLPPGCVFSPVSSVPWIQLSSTSQSSGSATIYYFVTRNDYGSRSGSINVAGASVQITQSGGGCTAILGASLVAFPNQGGTGTIPFTVSSFSCPWTALSYVPWIHINTSAGSGSGTTSFTAAPNPGSGSRSGQILIAGQLFTVTQSGGAAAVPSSYNITTMAGTGSAAFYTGGFAGDGGAAIGALLNQPGSVVFDSGNNYFIADTNNYRIRKVNSSGIMSTVAGNGTAFDTGDGGPAANAAVYFPSVSTLDASGNLYFSTGGYRIRKISPTGVITTVAGTGFSGTSTDGSPALNAIPAVSGLVAGPAGVIYISDADGSLIRSLSGGVLSFYAGTGVAGNNGDGLAPRSTQLSSPHALATDSTGALYVAESNRIRKITPTTVATIAGGGSGPDGENIPATSIAINAVSIALDNQGNLIYVDRNRVRRVTSDGKVGTIAGSADSFYSFTGDGGPALAATFSLPFGISVDSQGNIAVADVNNDRIRLLTPVYSTCNYTLSGNNLMLSGASGTANITVTTTPACAWNSMSNAPWITITSSGVGTGTATINYTSNTVTTRTGTAYIAGQPVTLTQSAGSGHPTPGPSKVGVMQTATNTWAIDANGNGAWDTGDRYFSFASAPGDIAVVGDWTGDGKAKAGVYRNGFWILDLNNNGAYDGAGVDRVIAFGGQPGDRPVVGDWNGDGRTKVGIYRGGFWLLDTNGNGVFDASDQFLAFGGNPGEQPVLGDWNGDGKTKVGFLYNGNWLLDYNGNGVFDAADKFYSFPYAAGDRAVVGDWNGTHTTKIGVYRNGFWLLDYNGNGAWDGVSGGDEFAAFGGNTGEIPFVGDWNGDGRTKIGYYLRGFWALDFNGNGRSDAPDRFFALGGHPGEQPIVGAW